MCSITVWLLRPTTYRYPILTFNCSQDCEYESRENWESGIERRTTNGLVSFLSYSKKTSLRPLRTQSSMSTREDPRFQFHREHRKEVEEYGTEFVHEHDGD